MGKSVLYHRVYTRLTRNMYTAYGFFCQKAERGHSEVMVGGSVVKLSPGQLVTSRNELADETGLSVQEARTALKKLEEFGIITREVVVGRYIFTLVTILDWQLPPEC